MSIQRTILEQELNHNNKGLEWYRAQGQHRCEDLNRPWKEPYHLGAGEIFWLEWRNKRITILLQAWFIIEDKSVMCPIVLKAITSPIKGGYILDDDLDAAASVAMLIC